MPRPLVLGAIVISFVAAGSPPPGRTNLLGGPLASCCAQPATGYARDGLCRQVEDDQDKHLVCAEVTQAFLDFSRSRGYDLLTPQPQFGFGGLKPGQRWCLRATRWLQADEHQVAPPVDLAATDEAALQVIPIERLRANAQATADGADKPPTGG